VALTVHEPPDDLRARDRRSDLFFVRWWKPHAVTLTEATRQAVAPLLGACPVRIIPNAAVLPPAAETAQAIAARQMHRPPTVLLVGALCERKGTDVFVRACGVLKRKGIPFHAEIVGGALDAAYGDSIRALVASEGLAETVVLAGERREGMDAINREGDVLAVPSRRENYPRVIMEAMGWGMPVVASAVDGIPSMVADGATGILVPPENPEALASAMERLLLSPQLRCDLGEAGRKCAETLFSPEKYADAMMELYNDAGVP
jgi:glycosyltransferase involved in cell wall biosynthesis